MYARILAAAESIPWAIRPEKGEAVAAVLSRLAKGERADRETVEAAKAGQRGRAKSNARPGGVALLPIYGTITQRADIFQEWSGGTSTDAAGRQLDEMVSDPGVSTIVLDVDSPGGTVYGVAEFGAKIAAAAKVKKVVAVANSEAASAAYWLASQAGELVVTPNGQVGSVGVYLMHRDQSRAIDAGGETVTLISAGERKVAANPYGPLDATGREELQASVNDYYDKFVRAVAAGRKTTLSAVREGFGKGGMVRAEAAVKGGMADRVATLDDVLAKFGVSAADLSASAQSDHNPAEIRRRRMLLG